MVRVRVRVKHLIKIQPSPANIWPETEPDFKK